MMTPIHRVGYSLRGLEVLRYEEDGTTITVRITPLATMEYLSTKSEGGGNLQKRRVPTTDSLLAERFTREFERVWGQVHGPAPISG